MIYMDATVVVIVVERCVYGADAISRDAAAGIREEEGLYSMGRGGRFSFCSIIKK